MNAIGYIRISPHLKSIAEQETAIKSFCQEKGLNLQMLFKDSGNYNEDLMRESWMAVEEYVKYNKGQVNFLLFLLPAKITRYNKMIDDIQEHFKAQYGVFLIAIT